MMLPASSSRHGVDGEIAALEIVLELHVRRELGGEAAIAGRHLALQARERVFFLGFRVQEHREVAAHGNESRAFELGRRRADHDPVALGHLAPEQPVPNRAAHQVHLHGAHVNRRSYWSRAHRLPRARRLRHHCTWPRRPRARCRSSPRASPSSGCWPIPATDAGLKQRLEVGARGAREFASRELGLPNNKSYTSYADLKREFVVWSVVATPEFSVEPREWCFPIVGCVAYRGYFREASAEAVRRSAAPRGLRHHRRRRAGVFDARQVQRPDPQHHDDLWR